MIRFASALAEGLKSRGHTVEILSPQPVLVKSKTGKGFSKWLAYVDKWILFPPRLRRVVRRRRSELGDTVRCHVCDHSNAPYLAHLPADRTAITCHDVLAIRGALGYPGSYCAASRTGVILQRWILRHLSHARRLACVSHLTLHHLCEIAGLSEPKPGWTVLHNAFNAKFERIEPGDARRILQQKGIALPQPFLLHVGSNLPRKNRRMLLQMSVQNGTPWSGHLCFTGEAADEMLLQEAALLGLANRIHSVPHPDHRTLCALYSLAHAFIFPSFSEGFGWPLIEAQACGVPVIASQLEPLPEVSGGAALHADPHDARSFAAALQSLQDQAVRADLIHRGFKNAARFDLETMTDGYLALHSLTGRKPVSA
jgi:glycosyltransferase involved in cell wall biosynthesis